MASEMNASAVSAVEPRGAAAHSARAKELARENGFPLNGIAVLPANGESPRSESYNAWLKNGLHGPLDYMLNSQPARSRMQNRFPWARSVLALGAFYDGAERGRPGRDLEAHVARYARGRDYHRIFTRRLKTISEALIKEGICTHAHYYVDTGPVLERAWAEAAGLGWIGKNACLIHPRLGSFFLLAEIVLDVELQADAAASDHCGTCTRCLESCPTQAFTSPGVLDAARCLVTWNIEFEGRTPKELWKQQGAWVAGCDICQTVCPYNNAARVPAPDAELAQPLPWQSLSMADVITMTEARFDVAFKASTLRRTGLNGLRLGAITAAGNLKLEECRQALMDCASDTDPEISERSAWALGCLNKSALVDIE